MTGSAQKDEIGRSWGTKGGEEWGAGEMAEGSREEERELPGRTARFQCFTRCPSP